MAALKMDTKKAGVMLSCWKCGGTQGNADAGILFKAQSAGVTQWVGQPEWYQNGGADLLLIHLNFGKPQDQNSCAEILMHKS